MSPGASPGHSHSRDFLLALDLGTTRVCALVVHRDGVVHGRAHSPLSASFPAPGRVEQNPDEMWQTSLRVLRQALDDADVGACDLSGIGVTSQRATALAWDARDGKPLGPAIGWQDQRTAQRVAELLAGGFPVSILNTATKWEWLVRHVPEVARAAEAQQLRLGTPDVWLTDRLTGGACFVTDPSHACATALYEAAPGRWSEAGAARLGIPTGALPSLVASAEIVGDSVSTHFGSPVPVAARIGDQQSACFAQGVHEAGQAKLTLGTSAMLDLHTGSTAPAPPKGTYPLVLWRLPGRGDEYCLEGTVVTAGSAVEWLVELGLLPRAEALDPVSDQVASSEGVVFVPALQGLGTPQLDAAARGLLLGLTRGTSAAHVAKATVEGLAQRCVDVCEAMPLGAEPLRVDGGLARSNRLLEKLADLLGRPVHRAAEVDVTALGAAQLAGLATGALPSPEACRATLGTPSIFEPHLTEPQRAKERERWKRAVECAREKA